ncbi:MAG: succinate dehydrogenase [Desulfurococcales archaeon]|nr:succinate dehydrogenase [Desulfurococcales archaeon]
MGVGEAAKRGIRFLRNMPGWRASFNPWILRIPNNPERVAFVLHRITGIILILVLFLHITVTSTPVTRGWEFWVEEISKAKGITPVTVYFFLFVGAALFHGLNGIRLILVEFLGCCVGKPEKPKPPYISATLRAPQRQLLYIVFALWVVLWMIAGFIIFG